MLILRLNVLFSVFVSLSLFSATSLAQEEPVPMETSSSNSDSEYELGFAGGWPHMIQFSVGKINPDNVTSLELGYTNLAGAEGTDFSMMNAGLRYQMSLSSWPIFFGASLGVKLTTAVKNETLSELEFNMETKTTTTTSYLQPFIGYSWYKTENSSISTELGFEWAYWYQMEFKSNSLDLDETGRHSLYSTDEYEKNREKVRAQPLINMVATAIQPSLFNSTIKFSFALALSSGASLAATNPQSPLTTKWQAEVPMAGQSSLRAADLNKDGVKDLLVGTGILSPKGQLCSLQARDGKTGKQLWVRPLPGDGFATPALQDVTGDGIVDIFMGGRFASFLAINGKDGKILWDLRRANPGAKWPKMNFNTAVLIPDEDGDKKEDLLIVQGGSNPDGKVIPSRIYKVSSNSGKILKVVISPDKKEIYSVPALIPDSKKVNLLIGTGGETLGGNLLALNLSNLKQQWQWASGEKGVIGSPLVYQNKTNKKYTSLVVTFGGEAASVDVESGKENWKRSYPGYESYVSPALLSCSKKSPRMMFHLSQGVYPFYKKAKWVMLDANSGKTIYEGPLGAFAISSPLALDWDQDGCDDGVFVTNKENGFGPQVDSMLKVISGASGKVLYDHKLSGFAASTPLITDLEGDGTLEIALAHWGKATVLGTPLENPRNGSLASISRGKF